MDQVLIFGMWLLPLLYLALLVDYGATFFLRTRTAARNPWLIAVAGLHTLYLVLRAVHIERLPLEGTYEILSVLALCTAAVYALLEWNTHDRRSGVFVLLLVFLFQYTSAIFLARAPGAGTAMAQSNWTRLHSVPAIIAYTAVSIAGIYGLLHRVDQRSLKSHHMGLLFDRLPPFELLGTMMWHALLVGFAAMTVTIALSPFIFTHAADGGGMTARVIAKIVLGSAAWLAYLIAILGRFIRRWPASRISTIAVVAFALTVIMLITSAVLP